MFVNFHFVANPEEERGKEGNVWPVQGLCHIYFRGILISVSTVKILL
jgi:hypothetical protein